MRTRPDTIVTLNGPAIEVRQLRKTYPGGVEAVKGIDLEVAQVHLGLTGDRADAA